MSDAEECLGGCFAVIMAIVGSLVLAVLAGLFCGITWRVAVWVIGL